MKMDRGSLSGHQGEIKFYKIEQIADCMEASTRSVRRWIKEGLLVAHRINGLVRISDADFQAFLSAYRDQ
jgi:excisionase family DNA binding protein